MRTKLLSVLLLASTAITGIASASPIVRDHRYDRPQPTVTYRRPEAARPVRWEGGVHVTARPTWMPVNYGFQVTAGNQVVPYQYGQDPYVEGIARGEWSLMGDQLQFSANENDGRVIDLGGRPLRSIEIQAEAGCTEITKVGVGFPGGSGMSILPARTLDAHSPNLRIDLSSAALNGVNRIIVYGTGTGTFRVLGA